MSKEEYAVEVENISKIYKELKLEAFINIKQIKKSSMP